MNLNPPQGTLGAENTTGRLLQHALANFATNQLSAINSMQWLSSSDPSGFGRAAVQHILSSEENSPGFQHLAVVLTDGEWFPNLLMNKSALSQEAATALAVKVAAYEPRLDIRLFRKVTGAPGETARIPSEQALRALALVNAISDCFRLASHLVQFLKHPSDKVRSKAALMLGRANWNQTRVEGLLASDDGRLRANTVESLWVHSHQEVNGILWAATHDKCGRVVVNALLGLCQVGDREAYPRLAKLADNTDPKLRCGAAWAMGEIGDAEFREPLEKLGQDHNARVKAMAEKSLTKLRAAVAPCEEPHVVTAGTPDEEEWPAIKFKAVAYDKIK